MSYKCRAALKDFEKAIAEANANAQTNRGKIAQFVRKNPRTGMDKAQADGYLDKVVVFEKALEAADGELEGDVAGISPTNATDVFRTVISMEGGAALLSQTRRFRMEGDTERNPQLRVSFSPCFAPQTDIGGAVALRTFYTANYPRSGNGGIGQIGVQPASPRPWGRRSGRPRSRKDA